jgi:hypothetical protein
MPPAKTTLRLLPASVADRTLLRLAAIRAAGRKDAELTLSILFAQQTQATSTSTSHQGGQASSSETQRFTMWGHGSVLSCGHTRSGGRV